MLRLFSAIGMAVVLAGCGTDGPTAPAGAGKVTTLRLRDGGSVAYRASGGEVHAVVTSAAGVQTTVDMDSPDAEPVIKLIRRGKSPVEIPAAFDLFETPDGCGSRGCDSFIGGGGSGGGGPFSCWMEFAEAGAAGVALAGSIASGDPLAILVAGTIATTSSAKLAECLAKQSGNSYCPDGSPRYSTVFPSGKMC